MKLISKNKSQNKIWRNVKNISTNFFQSCPHISKKIIVCVKIIPHNLHRSEIQLNFNNNFYALCVSNNMAKKKAAKKTAKKGKKRAPARKAKKASKKRR